MLENDGEYLAKRREGYQLEQLYQSLPQGSPERAETAHRCYIALSECRGYEYKVDNDRYGPWIPTKTGRFWLLDPRADEVHVEDVANSLSNLCRFNGHLEVFYSVAQHLVEGSYLVSEEAAQAFFIHDFAEAYVGDMITPLKSLVPQYREIEDKIQRVVAVRYGVAALPKVVEEVHLVDKRLQATESFQLTWNRFSNTALLPFPITIKPLLPEEARCAFLQRFQQLFPKEVLPRLT